MLLILVSQNNDVKVTTNLFNMCRELTRNFQTCEKQNKEKTRQKE